MTRFIDKLLLFVLLSAVVLVLQGLAIAEENASEALPPPEIVIDSPPPTQSPVKQETGETEAETVTIYESKVLPGFRPCTPEDYQNADGDLVACEDTEEARVISTRDKRTVSEDLIVEDDAVPQGNIFKLKFERFKKK